MENVGEARSAVRQWSEQHKHAVFYQDDGAASTLLDVESGKNLKLLWGEIAAFQEKIHPERGDRYLLLLFESGKQIALVDPGRRVCAVDGKFRGRFESAAGGLSERFSNA